MKQQHTILGALLLIALSATATAGPVFVNASYTADTTFTDASLSGTTVTVAFDGINYWSASGGSSFGVRYAQHDAAGSVVNTFSPGIDFRSVFTDGSGNVFARGFNSPIIYQQTAPGTFTNLLSLTGGTLGSQSSVVQNNSGQFVAMSGGTVNVWDATGVSVSTFSLSGYSGGYPENRGIAVADSYLFTYFNQILTAWDYSGNLLDQTSLVDAGTTFGSYFSLSYANSRIFVNDDSGGTWRGYNIGLNDSGPVPVPAPGVLGLMAVGLAGIGYYWRRKQVKVA